MEREYENVGPMDRNNPTIQRKRKPGPKRSNFNKGRPRVKLSDKEWNMIEEMAGHHCTLTEIMGVMKLGQRTFERLITDHYALSVDEFFEKYQQAGKAHLRSAVYRMACDGKHPVVTIFCAINWLGMQDTRTIIKKDESKNNAQSTELLGLIKDTLQKISSKPTPGLIPVNRTEQDLSKSFVQLNTVHKAKDYDDIEEAQIVDERLKESGDNLE